MSRWETGAGVRARAVIWAGEEAVSGGGERAGEKTGAGAESGAWAGWGKRAGAGIKVGTVNEKDVENEDEKKRSLWSSRIVGRKKGGLRWRRAGKRGRGKGEE
jgi:hypothetical protein